MPEERAAGKKLAKDIANMCNQLWSEGYDVSTIFPVTGGRVVEATVEAAEQVIGRTYQKTSEGETEYFVDTGAGYSVTDGVVIIAKLRNA